MGVFDSGKVEDAVGVESHHVFLEADGLQYSGMSEAFHFDVVVLGGGSGLTAAYYAELDGKSIALIDRQPDALGGTCVNRGCIPTKGLIQAAERYRSLQQLETFGISVPFKDVKVDIQRVFQAVRDRREKGASGTKGWVDGSFTPFYGDARFVGPKELEVDTDDGTVRVTGDAVFITTGARPFVPPIPGIDETTYWTNDDIFELQELPGSLLVLGGGYIGAEFAHFFSAFGTKVTIVEMFESLAPEDDDIKGLYRQEAGRLITLLEHTKAVEAFTEDGKPGLVVEDADGQTQRLTADAMLVAVGRTPNTDGLGLDAAGVKTNERGWIQVDDHLKTTADGVYAYGDVIGQGMFKHTSSFEGKVAYQNSQGGDKVMDYTANPHAVFVDPQIAGVGLTEQQAKQQGLSYKVAKKVYKQVMKGQIIGSPAGLAKLIVEEGTDKILGFHMAGPGAADMIPEVVVAMQNGLKAQAIRDTIHIHPTMPELIHSVFEAAG